MKTLVTFCIYSMMQTIMRRQRSGLSHLNHYKLMLCYDNNGVDRTSFKDIPHELNIKRSLTAITSLIFKRIRFKFTLPSWETEVLTIRPCGSITNHLQPLLYSREVFFERGICSWCRTFVWLLMMREPICGLSWPKPIARQPWTFLSWI